MDEMTKKQKQVRKDLEEAISRNVRFGQKNAKVDTAVDACEQIIQREVTEVLRRIMVGSDVRDKFEEEYGGTGGI